MIACCLDMGFFDLIVLGFLGGTAAVNYLKLRVCGSCQGSHED